jgi:hypothetical protein
MAEYAAGTAGADDWAAAKSAFAELDSNHDGFLSLLEYTAGQASATSKDKEKGPAGRTGETGDKR